MSPARLGVVAAIVAVATLTTTNAIERARETPSASDTQRDRRGGPDSTRVASLFAALGSGDPLVCELVSDQLGNYWGGSGRRIGRFGDARVDLQAAKDSASGHIAHAGTIDLLVSTLSTSNACVRRMAAKWLGRSAVETSRLVALLDDPSATVREAAAYALSEGHERKARVPLESMLARRGAAEAAMAAYALAEEQDAESAPALERAMRHTDARVRQSAAYALGEIGALRSLDALSGALRDSDAEVRYAAADAIGELDDLERPPSALLDACRSSDRRLARIAALIVADKHDPTTLDLLLSLTTSEDRDVRMHVAEALGEIGSARANPALMKLLNDADADVRRAAAEALGEIRENSPPG